ncbi:MAG: hypothetical protein ACFFCW_29780 [Candidatus Hodarchaeota archaeon]
MSDLFMSKNEPWFREMVKTKKLPAMTVLPRIGEHPIKDGGEVRWVRTFWQILYDTYCRDGAAHGETSGNQWAVCPNCNRRYGDLSGTCYWCMRLEGRQVALILTHSVTGGSW